MIDNVEKIIKSRAEICSQVPPLNPNTEEEGGCGVTGFICSIPVTGKNIFEPSVQMHNRGNGKGGGEITTGWRLFEITGSIAPGNHTLIIGGYNNRKTATTERTTILIDNVVLKLQ